MLNLPTDCANAYGLLEQDRALVQALITEWQTHLSSNYTRLDYYMMHNPSKMLGIAVPPEVVSELESHCGWAKKAVDVMVEHSKFDGMATSEPEVTELLRRIFRRNDISGVYRKAATSALAQGFCAFFVTDDGTGRAQITARTATNCTGIWDEAQGRITAGMFVVRLRTNPDGTMSNDPDWLDVVTDHYVIRLQSPREGFWAASYEAHSLGRCPMFMAAYEPTLERPFGTSRITREVMSLVDEAVRTFIDESVAAAFAAAPQRYLLGTDGDPFSETTRYAAFIGSIFNIDMTSEGTVPSYGQLPQPSMQPLSDHFRNLCGRMSAATGVHVSQFGMVHDQPASGDAIYMENEPLILKVQDWNHDAGHCLEQVACACLATEMGATYQEIEALSLDIMAQFKNPAMPTLSQMTDSAVKLASVAPWFPDTDLFWAMQGFSDDERVQLKRQKEEAERQQQLQNMLTQVSQAPVIEAAPTVAQAKELPPGGVEDNQAGQTQPTGQASVEDEG